MSLPAAGTYTVLLGDCGDVSTGNYAIYVQRVNNPTGASGVTFGGQPQTGTIGSAAQSNTYTFSASAQAVLSITITRAGSGSFSPKIRLYNSAGSQVGISYNGYPYGCSGGSTLEMNNTTLATAGTYTMLVGDCGDTSTATYSLSAQCTGCTSGPTPLSITGPSSPLPAAVVGSAYGPVTFTASGGSGGYTWTMTGSPSMPGGLSLSSGGVLSGTAANSSQGTYTLTVTVTDSSGTKASGQFKLTINPVPVQLTITGPSSLPSATVGAAYPAVTFTASGGTPPYTWTQTGLPGSTGLSLSAGGVLSGTPANGSNNTYTLTVTVTDSSGHQASGPFQLTIINQPPLTITGPNSVLPAATVGAAYVPVTFTSSGGTGGYTWQCSGLPAGLSLSAGGVLSGTPASGTQGSYTVTSTVTDSSSHQASESFQLTIINQPPLGITGPNSVLPAATVGAAYVPVTFTASGGTGGYTWQCTGLPAGLSVSPAGVLSGTPASGTQGSYTVACTVTDSSGHQVSESFQLTINVPAPIFTAPRFLNFTYEQGGSNPAPQTFSVFSNGAGVKYSVKVSANWLSALAATGQTPDNVTVTLQNLAYLPVCAGPAQCTDTATVTITPLGSGATAASPVTVTLTVIPVQPLLSVWPPYLTVSSVTGASDLQRQLQIFNTGGGTLNYTVTPPSVPWLTVSCGASGAVTLTTPASVCVTLNPAALQPGNYHAPLVITGGAGVQPATVNVTLQVTQAEPLVLLLPGAMEFTAVSGGQAPAPQTLNVLNIGTGTMDWSAQASGKWLQLSTSGCASASQTVTGSATSAANGGPAGSLTVCVDLAQAALGGNYGQIAVSVPNGPTGNSEVIAVLLNVLPSGSALPELAAPTGVILRATPGTPAPTGTVTLSNPNGTLIGFTTATVTQDGTAWLSVSQPSGSLAGHGTAPLQVQGNAAALGVGIYHGQVRVGFSDGTSAVINVILTVSPGSGAASVGASARGRREHPMASPPSCPGGTVLPPQFINLSEQGFQVQAGSVQQLLVQVQDSCGNQITDAAADVGATLSVVIYNSATQATLETPNLVYSDTQKAWQYGWTPTSAEVGPVGMYAVAGVGVGNNSIGNRSDIWTGTVTGAAAGTAAEPTAVANAASVNLDTIVQVNQVAAGSYIAIYGELLADPGTGNPYPFPTEDQGSRVLLGGVPLLLEYVSPTQVNALVPTTAGLPLNAPLPLKIQRDGTLSVNDLQVSVTTVQPAIYVLDQNSQGAVLIAGTADVAAPVGSPWPGSRPAQAGVDYIEIFCNGLGPVTNPPGDGQPAGDPAPTPGGTGWTVSMPQVTIGGVTVPATFSGLSPGSVSLYQVNVQVAAGSQTGNAVPITIQMGDVSSNTAYIAVQ